MKFIKTLINNNPIFVLMLGLCSSLAVTNNLENAYLMGISLTFVLLCSNIIICLIKKHVSDNIKIPVYIMIIGTFVTVLEILLSNYIKPLYQSLGIYLSLIVVNCIVLGRALEVASKQNIKTTIKDSLTIGLGYTISLIIIAVIREILGNGTLTLTSSIANMLGYKKVVLEIPIYKISIFQTPAGAFLTLAFLLCLFNYVKEKIKWTF